MSEAELRVNLGVCQTALRDIITCVEGTKGTVFVHGLVHKIATSALGVTEENKDEQE